MTTTYDPEPVLAALRSHGLTGSHPQWQARCPAHGEQHASMSFGVVDDHGVFNCHAQSCGRLDILDALGLKVADLYPPRDAATSRSNDDWMPCGWKGKDQPIEPGHRKVAEYLYRDETGAVVVAVARCVLKGNGCQGFRQWRPDPTGIDGRRWRTELPDKTKAGAGIPYRLPELLANLRQPWDARKDVYIVGGEKDAERARTIGLVATTNLGGETTDKQGASKWTDAHAKWLADADVIVIADRDPTGRRWAQAVVASLLGVASSIEVRQAAAGNDLSDHLDAGLRIDDLVTVAKPTPDPIADPIEHGCPQTDCPTCALEAVSA